MSEQSEKVKKMSAWDVKTVRESIPQNSFGETFMKN